MHRPDKPNREDLERLAVTRYLRGGRHFGSGPGFGAGRGGRKRRGDVRAALLLLMAKEPRNGYQLMDAVEERSGGRGRPSPGSVYPTLAQLEDEGLIRAVESEGGKRFELTEAGQEHSKGLGDRDAPWEGACEPDEEFAAAVQSLVPQVHLAAMQVAQAGDVEQLKRAAEVLAQTKRELYRILAEDADE
jgi:DNA-binding PadR family transcriptional regulator